MDKILYHYFLPKNENRVKAGFFESAPANTINLFCNGEIDPVYDEENNRIIEHKSVDIFAKMNQEIEILDKQNTREISEYLAEHLEREKMRGIPIPAEVHLKYNEMIKNFHIKKTEIIEKYKNK